VSQQRKAKPTNTDTKPIQFDWRKKWRKKVKPHLQNPFVQFALDLGMRLYTPDWKPGDPPFLYGAIAFDSSPEPRKDTLRWYQPLCRCHYIAFFSMVIGVINYPELNWKFTTGKFHTVPVGYDENGQPRVVMDILLSDMYTAQQSIEFALSEKGDLSSGWKRSFQMFETDVASAIREALANRDKLPREHYLKSLLKRICEQVEVGSNGEPPSERRKAAGSRLT
jgi:hypothetical protein